MNANRVENLTGRKTVSESISTNFTEISRSDSKGSNVVDQMVSNRFKMHVQSNYSQVSPGHEPAPRVPATRVGHVSPALPRLGHVAPGADLVTRQLPHLAATPHLKA